MAIFSKKKKPIPFETFLRIMKELDIIKSFKGTEFKDIYNSYITKELNTDWWYPFHNCMFYINGQKYSINIDTNANKGIRWWWCYRLDLQYFRSFPCTITIYDFKTQEMYISYCMPKKTNFMYEVFMVIFAIAAKNIDDVIPFLSSSQTKVFKVSTRLR